MSFVESARCSSSQALLSNISLNIERLEIELKNLLKVNILSSFEFLFQFVIINKLL